MNLASMKTHLDKIAENSKAFFERLGHWLGTSCARLYDRLEPGLKKIEESLRSLYRRLKAQWHRLTDWWDRRGLPPAVLQWFGLSLLYIAADTGIYLWGSLTHVIPFDYRWLLTWLIVVETVRTLNFWFKALFPDRRKANRSGTDQKGIQQEGGST